MLSVTSWLFFGNLNTPWQHFSDQAQSFLQGRLDVDPNPYDKHDYVILNGKYFWPQSPFPSVILAPFQIIFGPEFKQGIMQLILIIILTFSIFKLAQLKKFNFKSCIYLTSIFLMGTPLAGLIVDPKSWFFAQVVATTLLTLLIAELETKKRLLLMGVLGAAILATRPTAALIIFALLFFIYKERITNQKKLFNFLSLLLPSFVSIFILMWFNYARFGNPLNNGYLNNDVGGFIEPLRNLGLFSLQHIPTNFYYYFLASLDPVFSNISIHLKFPFVKYNVWGLSLFLVAPFFLYSLKSLKKASVYLKSLWIVVGATLLLHLSYYAPGWYQFGPRYTADFMPIIFLLTLNALNPPALTKNQRILILISTLFNIYLLTTAR